MTTETIERDTTDRRIHLEKARNVRHLGGHPTASGHDTTAFDVIRSGSLHEMTEAGQTALADRGVKVVVDFRSDIERETYPTPELTARDITIIEAPVFQADYSPGALARIEEYPGHAATYQQFLTEGGEAYRTLFEILATASGPVLFHCAAGKDRTGVAAALLLDLAGVPDEHIIADYALSTSELEPFVEERMERFEEYGISIETGRLMMAAPPGEMELTLDFIRGRWGSAAGYMGTLGLNPSTIEAVRSRMFS
ncbi:MAG: tyrosine-protein phosphatase [Chloroflexi bacterium]|nr:tyrosine-protein phosphatase [Chloroflexota bacterium]